MTLPIRPGTVGALLEYLEFERHIGSRKEMAAELNIEIHTLGRLYRCEQPLSAKLILHIHEYFGMAVWEIRERSGQYDTAKREAGLQAGSGKRNTEDAMIAHKISRTAP